MLHAWRSRLYSATETYESSSAGRRWVVIFLIVLGGYAISTNYGPLFFIDAGAAFHPAWHLVHHGHLWVDDGSLRIFAFVEGRDGHLYSNRPPGVVAVAVPFYFLLRGGDAAPSGVPAAIAAVMVTAAAVATVGLVMEFLLSRRQAFTAALLVGFGTSMWSVAAAELFAHGPDILWLSLALLALLSRKEWLAGLAFAAGITTRPQLAVVALILGVAAAWSRRRFRTLIAVGFPAALGLVAYLLYNKYIFGSFNLQGGYEPYVNVALTGELRGSKWDYLHNVLGTFFSGSRGLLTLTPVLIVLLPAIRAGWRQAPWWARSSALSGLAVMLIQWQTQSGPGGFLGGYLFYSYRYSLEPLILCVPLLAVCYRECVIESPLRKLLFNLAALFSVWIQGVGAFAYAIDASMRFNSWLAWSPLTTLQAATPGDLWVAVVALAPVMIVPIAFAAHADRAADAVGGV